MMGILLIVLLLVMVAIEVRAIADKLFRKNERLFFREIETECMYPPFPTRRITQSSKTS